MGCWAKAVPFVWRLVDVNCMPSIVNMMAFNSNDAIIACVEQLLAQVQPPCNTDTLSLSNLPCAFHPHQQWLQPSCSMTGVVGDLLAAAVFIVAPPWLHLIVLDRLLQL